MKGLPLRIVPWVLTSLLGAVLFLTGDPSRPGVHLSARFLQDGPRETGMSPFFAVLTDYRGFDLWVLALLILPAGLLCLLPALSRLPQVPVRGKAAWGLGILLLGTTGALGVGVFTLLHGSNLLDLEAFARFASPEEARRLGAFWLGGGCLLAAAGALWSFTDAPEVSHGD